MNGLVEREFANQKERPAHRTLSASHIDRNTLSSRLSTSDIERNLMEAEKNICNLTRSKYIELKWKKISEVADRLFFWLFLLFLIIPLVSLLGFIRVFKTKFET